MLAPPDRHAEPSEILALLKQGESVKQLETVRVTKGGVRLDVSISISPVRDAAGRVVSAASIAHDITERKRAQDELRRARDKLEAMNSELQLSLAREEALARTDGLTGLYNRSYFKELAAREFSAAARYQRALSILMIDVDNFKSINDTLGHAAGDQVLALIAQTAGRHIRAADVLARFGGDEFILLLPETNSRQARTVADRIRAGIAATPVQAGMASLAVTLSIGIAGLRPGPAVDSMEELIQRADQALYRAKAEGRNRVVALEQDGT